LERGNRFIILVLYFILQMLGSLLGNSGTVHNLMNFTAN